MRRLLVICALALFAQAGSAQWTGPWFAVNLQCRVNGGQAICEIANTGNMPMYCNLRADFGIQPVFLCAALAHS